LKYKYFELFEFASPDEPGSENKMKKDFIQKLDKARDIAGVPFIITSAYRTENHNREVGGRIGSSHCKGLAVDLLYNGSRDRYLILNALLKVGINRIGLGKSFIHCDVDLDKDENVIWTYDY